MNFEFRDWHYVLFSSKIVRLRDARQRKGYIHECTVSTRFIVAARTPRRPVLPRGSIFHPFVPLSLGFASNSVNHKISPFSRSRKRRFGLSSLPEDSSYVPSAETMNPDKEKLELALWTHFRNRRTLFRWNFLKSYF